MFWIKLFCLFVSIWLGVVIFGRAREGAGVHGIIILTWAAATALLLTLQFG